MKILPILILLCLHTAAQTFVQVRKSNGSFGTVDEWRGAGTGGGVRYPADTVYIHDTIYLPQKQIDRLKWVKLQYSSDPNVITVDTSTGILTIKHPENLDTSLFTGTDTIKIKSYDFTDYDKKVWEIDSSRRAQEKSSICSNCITIGTSGTVTSVFSGKTPNRWRTKYRTIKGKTKWYRVRDVVYRTPKARKPKPAPYHPTEIMVKRNIFRNGKIIKVNYRKIFTSFFSEGGGTATIDGKRLIFDSLTFTVYIP